MYSNLFADENNTPSVIANDVQEVNLFIFKLTHFQIRTSSGAISEVIFTLVLGCQNEFYFEQAMARIVVSLSAVEIQIPFLYCEGVKPVFFLN